MAVYSVRMLSIAEDYPHPLPNSPPDSTTSSYSLRTSFHCTRSPRSLTSPAECLTFDKPAMVQERSRILRLKTELTWHGVVFVALIAAVNFETNFSGYEGRRDSRRGQLGLQREGEAKEAQ